MKEPRIVRSGERKLVGLRRRASFHDAVIGDLWRDFRPRVPEITSRMTRDFISMRIYDPPLETVPRADARFLYWAAVEVAGVDDVPVGLATHTIADGLYAVFEHHGTAESFARTAEFIFGHWLPESPYLLAPREFFEVLGPTYRPDDPHAVEDVWIPIREAR